MYYQVPRAQGVILSTWGVFPSTWGVLTCTYGPRAHWHTAHSTLGPRPSASLCRYLFAQQVFVPDTMAAAPPTFSHSALADYVLDANDVLRFKLVIIVLSLFVVHCCTLCFWYDLCSIDMLCLCCALLLCCSVLRALVKYVLPVLSSVLVLFLVSDVLLSAFVLFL